MRIKDRLHRTFTLIILSVLIVTGVIILLLTRRFMEREMHKQLTQTSLIIRNLVQNFVDLNVKILLGNLKVLESEMSLVELRKETLIGSGAEHHITRLNDFVQLPELRINGRAVFNDSELVDHVAAITGGNVSILQFFPQGLLKIATNIRRGDGTRMTQSYLPLDNPVTEEVGLGRTYVGFVMNKWHLVAYKPIFAGGNVVGAIHVGFRPDIADLRRQILDVEIGSSGRPFIVDTEGNLIIDRIAENQNVYHLSYIKEMIRKEGDGTVNFRDSSGLQFRDEEVLLHYRLVPSINWIVAVGSYEREFFVGVQIITHTFILSIVVAFLIAFVASLQFAENLTEPIKRLTDCIEAVRSIRFDFEDQSAVERIRADLTETEARDEEIFLMTVTFSKMLDELEDNHRQLINKYRHFRHLDISKKIKKMLEQDIKTIHNVDTASQESPREEVAGAYFDRAVALDGEVWYAIGSFADQNSQSDLIMTIVQSSINSIIRSMPETEPVELAEFINTRVAQTLRDSLKAENFRFLSFFLSLGKGCYRYIGPPLRILLYRNGSNRCESLNTAPILRTGEIQLEIASRSFRMEAGDIAVMEIPRKEGPPTPLEKLADYILRNHYSHADELAIALEELLGSRDYTIHRKGIPSEVLFLARAL